jgi:hypothetical protein
MDWVFEVTGDPTEFHHISLSKHSSPSTGTTFFVDEINLDLGGRISPKNPSGPEIGK